MSDSLRPRGLYSPWNSPGQDTGVGSLSLLQGIFPTQGSNQGLLHCRQLEKQNDSSLVTKAKSRTYTSLLHKACFPLLSGSRPKPLMWNKGCSLALLSLALPPCPLLSKCQHLLSSVCFSKLLCRFLCHELTSSIYPKHVTLLTSGLELTS